MIRSIAFTLLGLTAIMVNPSLAFDVGFTVVDGTESYVDIQLKGTMTDWVPIAMNDADGDHTWNLTIDVPPGTHEWGAIEDDGSEWGIWLIDGANLAFTVDDEGNVAGQTSYIIPTPNPTVNVTFLVDMNAEDVSAQGVHVAGSFQGWFPDTTEMLDPDGDGIFEVTLELEENTTHHYKYINGSSWNDAESVPANCGVDDGYGGFNREINVPDAAGGDQVAGFVFGTCDIPTAGEESTLSYVKALYR